MNQRGDMKKQIRVLIVDDHFMVRMGLATAINLDAGMKALPEAGSGRQALEFYREHLPDVVLMDLRLPGMNGIETTTLLRGEFPSAKVIIISSYDCIEDVYRALQAGAVCFLPKTVSRRELLHAIRAVHSGERYLPAGVAAQLAEWIQTPEISKRELEVLQFIAKDRSNKEIASRLFIAGITVKNHVTIILRKLNAVDRTHAR